MTPETSNTASLARSHAQTTIAGSTSTARSKQHISLNQVRVASRDSTNANASRVQTIYSTNVRADTSTELLIKMLPTLLQTITLVKQVRGNCAYTYIARSTSQSEKPTDTGRMSLF
jgi:hypothetical protein